MTATETATETTEAADRKGRMPTYSMTKVSELPEDLTASGRSDLYFNLLTQVTKDPGEWYEVAHFKTPGGARSALGSITKKNPETGKTERRIPDGEWEFEVRRVQNPENAAGPKHSKLFARFMG